MFISSLALTNILSFRDTSLELKPLNILIGPNGSGKSNLIAIIALLRSIPSGLGDFLLRRGGPEAWIWRGKPQGPSSAQVTYEFELDQEPLKYGIAFGAVNHSLVIHKEFLVSAGNQDVPGYLFRDATNLEILGESPAEGRVKSSLNWHESALAVYRNPLSRNPLLRSGRMFGEIRIYEDFRTTVDDTARSGIASAAPKYPLDESGANLPLVLQEMDFQGSLQQVKSYLRRLSDRFEDIKIRPEGGISQLYIQERGPGMVSSVMLSDGTLKFLCLMAILCDRDPPPLICIEEPESGLHPEALDLVAGALREASSRTQLIVTTHSDALVDRFTDEPETVIVCERDFDESTSFKRLDHNNLREWLDEYSLGDLWRRGEIGGTLR
jgi:predicted ATPase